MPARVPFCGNYFGPQTARETLWTLAATGCNVNCTEQATYCGGGEMGLGGFFSGLDSGQARSLRFTALYYDRAGMLTLPGPSRALLFLPS